jgi:hypothetical protein
MTEERESDVAVAARARKHIDVLEEAFKELTRRGYSVDFVCSAYAVKRPLTLIITKAYNI